MIEPTPRVRIARVDREEEDGHWLPVGTAFFLTDTHALTALHVVSARDDDRERRLKLRVPGTGNIPVEVTAELSSFDEDQDWALLVSDPQVGGPEVDLAPAPPNGAHWWTSGFPSGRTEDGLTIRGEVVQASATDRRQEALQLFSPQLTAGEVARGLSGAPVVVDGKVVGLLRSAFERLPNRVAAGTLYASSVTRIASELERRLEEGEVPMASKLRTALERVDRSSWDRRRPALGSAAPAAWHAENTDDRSLELRVEISGTFFAPMSSTTIVIRLTGDRREPVSVTMAH